MEQGEDVCVWLVLAETFGFEGQTAPVEQIEVDAKRELAFGRRHQVVELSDTPVMQPRHW